MSMAICNSKNSIEITLQGHEDLMSGNVLENVIAYFENEYDRLLAEEIAEQNRYQRNPLTREQAQRWELDAYFRYLLNNADEFRKLRGTDIRFYIS